MSKEILPGVGQSPQRGVSRRGFLLGAVVAGLGVVIRRIEGSRSAEAENRFWRELLDNGSLDIPDNPFNPSEPLGYEVLGPGEYKYRGDGDSSVIGRVRTDCITSGEGGGLHHKRRVTVFPDRTHILEFEATRHSNLGGVNNRPRAIFKFFDSANNLLGISQGDISPQQGLDTRELYTVEVGTSGYISMPSNARFAEFSLRATDFPPQPIPNCPPEQGSMEIYRVSFKVEVPSPVPPPTPRGGRDSSRRISGRNFRR